MATDAFGKTARDYAESRAEANKLLLLDSYTR